MRQQFNSIPVQAKVLEWPDYDQVLWAELANESIQLDMGFCYSGRELVTKLPLFDIRRIKRLGQVGFKFMGDHTNFSLAEFAGLPALQVTRGPCLVRVDELEPRADIGFKLAFCTEPLTTE